MDIFLKRRKPDNFELHNSLKLSLTNIQGLRSNFIERKSFLESNSPDILALCETNLDDSIDYGNFSVRGYLPLIQKDSVTHMHGVAVYGKEGLPFGRKGFRFRITVSRLLMNKVLFVKKQNTIFPPSISVFFYIQEAERQGSILSFLGLVVLYVYC